jgi:hypothetical protein
MYPPIFLIVSQVSAVTDRLGTNPVRFWPFGLAPQGEQRPYAVHQLVYGSPENTLSCPPDLDNFGVQIDCYAKTVTDARGVAEVIRDAIEDGHAHVTAWNGESWERDTGLYRVSFTAEFWQNR